MLEQILSELAPSNTTLVVVSKTRSLEQIQAIYDKGPRIFGENRVQELMEKQAKLPSDIEWHLIGHLQTNKVKYIAPFVAMIHSVESLKLLKEINKQAKKADRVIQCLLQFHIAEEETKFGLTMEEVLALINSEAFDSMQNVQICGVMGMATFTDNKEQVRTEFKTLKQIFNKLKTEAFADDEHFKEISMGMSGDYLIAASEGSTMVRIGSLLFK